MTNKVCPNKQMVSVLKISGFAKTLTSGTGMLYAVNAINTLAFVNGILSGPCRPGTIPAG